MTRAERFDEWYAAYPRQKGRKAAQRVWERIPLEELPAVREGLQRYIESEELRECLKEAPSGKFIKHPATWLHQECWTDSYVITIPKQPQRAAVIDRCEWPGCETYAVTSDIGGRNKRCSEHYHMKEVTP